GWLRSRRGGCRLPPPGCLLSPLSSRLSRAGAGRRVEVAARHLPAAQVVERGRHAPAQVPRGVATVREAAALELARERGHAAADHVERLPALAARRQRLEQLAR